MRETEAFLHALRFMTVLPVRNSDTLEPDWLTRASGYFPAVGIVIGIASAIVFAIASRYWAGFIPAVLAIATGVLLTGALHEDGMADTADGFGGGRTRDEVLRIMRDHAIGSYGAGALILVIAFRIAAIAGLIGGPRALPALLLAPAIGRWSAVLLSATQDYARPLDDERAASPGSPSRWIGRRELIIATIVAVPLAALAGRGRGAVALAAAAGGTLLWGRWCRRRIGGVTGDTIGAGIEASECLALLVFSATC